MSLFLRWRTVAWLCTVIVSAFVFVHARAQGTAAAVLIATPGRPEAPVPEAQWAVLAAVLALFLQVVGVFVLGPLILMRDGDAVSTWTRYAVAAVLTPLATTLTGMLIVVARLAP